MKALIFAAFVLLLACSAFTTVAAATAPANQPLPLSFKVEEPEGEAETRVFAWAFLLLVTVLIIAFILGYAISEVHCEFFSEAAGAIILGFLIGIFVKYIGGFEKFTQLVQFNQEFFFLVLLPPIIFESGYNMQKVRFNSTHAPHINTRETWRVDPSRFGHCFGLQTPAFFYSKASCACKSLPIPSN